MPNTPLTDEERLELRVLVERLGLAEAARRLGIGREPLLRAVAGLGNYRATVVALRAGLAAVEGGT